MNHLRAFCHRSAYWRKLVRVIVCAGLFLDLSTVSSAEEVAILKSADISAYSEAITAFKSALPPSFHATSEYDLKDDMAEGRNLAHRIRASNAKVVLAVGLKAAVTAKLQIHKIPVIFCLVIDPKKYGLPTDNMVGLSFRIPFHQRLQTLQTLVPNISRIGVLFDPEKTKGMLNQLLQDAETSGIRIVTEEVSAEKDVSKALNAIKNRIDALWLLPDSTILNENTLDFLLSTTLEANVPLLGFSADLVRSGAVVGTYFRYADIGKLAAQLSHQLARQTSPSLLGTIISPGRVRRSINLRSARHLGLSVTFDLLRQFDEQF